MLNERILLENDLSEYKASKEFNKAYKALLNNEPNAEDLIEEYYTKRNSYPISLTYESQEARRKGIDLDKHMSRMYKNFN